MSLRISIPPTVRPTDRICCQCCQKHPITNSHHSTTTTSTTNCAHTPCWACLPLNRHGTILHTHEAESPHTFRCGTCGATEQPILALLVDAADCCASPSVSAVHDHLGQEIAIPGWGRGGIDVVGGGGEGLVRLQHWLYGCGAWVRLGEVDEAVARGRETGLRVVEWIPEDPAEKEGGRRRRRRDDGVASAAKRRRRGLDLRPELAEDGRSFGGDGQDPTPSYSTGLDWQKDAGLAEKVVAAAAPPPPPADTAPNDADPTTGTAEDTPAGNDNPNNNNNNNKNKKNRRPGGHQRRTLLRKRWSDEFTAADTGPAAAIRGEQMPMPILGGGVSSESVSAAGRGQRRKRRGGRNRREGEGGLPRSRGGDSGGGRRGPMDDKFRLYEKGQLGGAGSF